MKRVFAWGGFGWIPEHGAGGALPRCVLQALHSFSDDSSFSGWAQYEFCFYHLLWFRGLTQQLCTAKEAAAVTVSWAWFLPQLPLWMRFICWHIPTSLFRVSQICLTGRRLKFYENQYLHKEEGSTFLLLSRVGSTVWARRWWVALTRRPTHAWPEVHCLSLLGWCGERRGPGGCKASWEFTAALISLCQHRKPWCTRILMSISRGNCRLETKQALALQFREKPGAFGWGSQKSSKWWGRKVLQFILWVMDLIKEKLPYCELLEVPYRECRVQSANGFQKKMGWIPLYTFLAHELKEHRGVPPYPSSQTGRSWWKKVLEYRRAMWTQPGVTGEDHVGTAGPAVRAKC